MSTDEKLGAEALLLPDVPLEPLDAEPDADGVDELLPDADGVDDDGDDVDGELPLLDDELCATAMPDSANNAAAVAALTTFRFNIG